MTSEINMSSNRPYLLRAFYQWIVDNECTPHIVVEADMPHVSVPPQTIKDGQVVLNVAPSAVHGLTMDDGQVTFSARFGGVPFEVYIPMYAISAIYARENGAGTMFPPEEIDDDMLADEQETSDSILSVVEESDNKELDKAKSDDKKPKKGSHLSIVKKK